MLEKIILVTVLITLSLFVKAATFTSTEDGKWNVGKTWGGSCSSGCIEGSDFPGLGDAAVISPGTRVIIPGSFYAKASTLSIGVSTYCGPLPSPGDASLILEDVKSKLLVRFSCIMGKSSSCTYTSGKESSMYVNGGEVVIGTDLSLESGIVGGKKFNTIIYLGDGTLSVTGKIHLRAGSTTTLSKIDFENKPNSTLISRDSVKVAIPTAAGGFPGFTTSVIASAQIINDSGRFILNGSDQTISIANNEFSHLIIDGPTGAFKKFTDIDYIIIKDTLEMVSNATFELQPTPSTPSNGYVVYKDSLTVLKYSGSIVQTSDGPELHEIVVLPNTDSKRIPNLLIDNSSSGSNYDVALRIYNLVFGTLNLKNGRLALSSFYSIGAIDTCQQSLWDPSKHSSLEGSNPDNLLASGTDSYVLGGLNIIDVPAGTSFEYELPVGTKSGYAPVFIKAPAGGSFFAVVKNCSVHPTLTDPNRTVNYFWHLDYNNPAAAIDIELSWPRGDEGANFNSNISNGVYIGHFNGEHLGVSTAWWQESLSTFTEGVMRSAYIANYTGGFSPFSIGSGLGALPVELLSFNATKNKQHVILNWSTASEINNDYFVIERSENGIDFIPIQQMEGNGNSNVYKFYKTTDKDPQEGVNYYRLKQVDFDGSIHYSDVISIELDLLSTLNFFPNPLTSSDVLKINKAPGGKRLPFVSIYSMNGQLLLKKELHSPQIELEMNQIGSGVYQLVIQNGEVIQTEKLVVY